MIKDKIKREEIYHIYNKSIDDFSIFQEDRAAARFIQTLYHYNELSISTRFSYINRQHYKFESFNLFELRQDVYVKFLAYCIMPNHYHLLLRVLSEEKFSHYINTLENSFSRYYNTKNKRKGPLWQSRFQSVRITSNHQLLHTTRYIHLNPVVANLVEKPEDWEHSSYKDFINPSFSILSSLSEISIEDPLQYKKFVEDRIDYQKRLKYIKRLPTE